MRDSSSKNKEDHDADDVESLAEVYLESLQQEVDEEHLDELEERIADGKKRREKLVEEHGEEHHLVQKASEVIEKLQAEREELKDTNSTIIECRENLLKAIVDDPGFEFDEQWMKPQVVHAVTHALYGIEDSDFIIHNRQIRQTEDISELDEFALIEMEHVIVSLARDQLEGNETVEKQWERLSDSVALPAIKEVARNDPSKPKDVASTLDEDTTTVKDRLKNFMKWDEFMPLYRPEKGVYGLSTTGKYLMWNYADLSTTGTIERKDSPTEGSSETTESDQSGSQASPVQTTIGNSDKGDIENELESPESETESNGESMDTEEKAEEMFADVGDSQEAGQ